MQKNSNKYGHNKYNSRSIVIINVVVSLLFFARNINKATSNIFIKVDIS